MESFRSVKEFWDYLEFSTNGITGIREDAPESAKKAYEEYEKKRIEALNKGEKL